MAENPLLPNRKLQDLYRTLLHCAALDRPARRAAANSDRPDRSGLLAATSIHLEPGDRLSPLPGDTAAASLAPEPLRRLPNSPGTWPLPAAAPRLYLNAAAAATLKEAGDRVQVALTAKGQHEPGWVEALTWAQRELLPMVLICADPSGARAMQRRRGRPSHGLTWDSLNATTRKLQLPTVIVDGNDAVAVYRVMQESVLRARMGGGPAVVWAILPAPGETLKLSAKPQARLRRYLTVRNIAIPD